MLAKDYFSDVEQDKVFRSVNGVIVHNIKDLHDLIESMSEYDFTYHVDENHDDFKNWLEEVVGWHHLSRKLKGVIDREKYLKIISREMHRYSFLSFHSPFSAEFYKDSVKGARHVFKGITHFMIDKLLLFVILILLILIFADMQGTSLSASENQDVLFLERKIDYLQTELENISRLIEDLDDSVMNVTQKSQNPEQHTLFYYVPGPADHLSRDLIIVREKGLSINISDEFFIGKVGDTKSMLPVLTNNTHTIEVSVKNSSLIHPGDIVSFFHNDSIVIHRILQIGFDSEGWYALTKGDNNVLPDPQVIRVSDIRGLVVGIIY